MNAKEEKKFFPNEWWKLLKSLTCVSWTLANWLSLLWRFIIQEKITGVCLGKQWRINITHYFIFSMVLIKYLRASGKKPFARSVCPCQLLWENNINRKETNRCFFQIMASGASKVNFEFSSTYALTLY